MYICTSLNTIIPVAKGTAQKLKELLEQLDDLEYEMEQDLIPDVIKELCPSFEESLDVGFEWSIDETEKGSFVNIHGDQVDLERVSEVLAWLAKQESRKLGVSYAEYGDGMNHGGCIIASPTGGLTWYSTFEILQKEGLL